jgi:hypothetical protein
VFDIKFHQNDAAPAAQQHWEEQLCVLIVQRFRVDVAAEGQPGRQLQDDHDCHHLPGRGQLQRDPVNAALRQPGQEHHQHADSQRGR